MGPPGFEPGLGRLIDACIAAALAVEAAAQMPEPEPKPFVAFAFE